MAKFKFLLLLFVISCMLLVFGCSGSPDTVTQPNPASATERVSADNNRVVWGAYRLNFDPSDGSVTVLPDRELGAHLNVTNYVKPPMCYDCVQITGSFYNPQAMEWSMGIALKNPSVLPGYDVRGLVFDLGVKSLKNYDGYMNKYFAQDIYYKAFAKADPVRAFWPFTTNQENYVFYYPPGAGWASVGYIVDACFPKNAPEPIIENVSFPSKVENGYLDDPLSVTAFDHQGDFFVVIADLSPIGGDANTVLWDDGQHSDGDADDGVFAADNLKAAAPEGTYLLKIWGYDTGLHYGYTSVKVDVTGGVINNDPVVDEITASRTTCTKGSDTEKVNLQCVAHDPDFDDLDYHWTADAGSFTSTDTPTATWKPPSVAGKYYIYCEVTDPFGGKDTGTSPKMRVTKYTIMQPAPAPDFSSTRLIGSGTFHLSDYTPGDVVMMNLWATT